MTSQARQVPRLCQIGREQTIFKPIELVDECPHSLKFRQPEFDRAGLLIRKTDKRDNTKV
jgi:hypothetical protein